MPSTFALRLRAALPLLAALTLASAARAAAPLEKIPVKPPADDRNTTADTDPDGPFLGHTAATFGVGGLIGLPHDSRGSIGGGYWGGLTHYGRDFYVSGRGSHMYVAYDAHRPDPNQDCCSDNLYDATAIVGVPISTNHLFWVGTGISRLQRTKGDPNYDKNYVTAAVPVEVVFTNVRHPVGVEGRLGFQLAGAGKNYFGAMFGVNFGASRS